MVKKTNKNKKQRSRAKSKRKKEPILAFGDIAPSRRHILALLILIIFTGTAMVFADIIRRANPAPTVAAPAPRKNAALEKQIIGLVKGYPIARMAPYIADKDPKVAAFLVSIAKKESNWGKRKPVLDGRDCFNYWGFRLKSERMGSGGHTCFDSPKAAVDTVAARLSELVNVEKIDSPKKMVVWKCGYGCRDGEKSASELKWIRDVDFYYGKLAEFL